MLDPLKAVHLTSTEARLVRRAVCCRNGFDNIIETELLVLQRDLNLFVLMISLLDNFDASLEATSSNLTRPVKDRHLEQSIHLSYITAQTTRTRFHVDSAPDSSTASRRKGLYDGAQTQVSSLASAPWSRPRRVGSILRPS